MSTTISHLDISENVTLAQQGEIKAFERLIDASQNAITSIALSITKDLDASEDVAQQTYIKAWKDINQLKNGQSFLPWIRQITRYTALNYIKTQSAGVTSPCADYDSLLATLSNNDVPADVSLIKQQQSELISHLLDQLETETREIVLLYYREQQNSNAVAQLLDVSPALVRKKLQRAREQLKPEILNTYGNVIYSSTPASLVAIVLAVVAPTAMGGLSGASATGLKLGVKSPVLMSIIGVLLPLLLALTANHLSMAMVIKNVHNTNAKNALRQLRKQTTFWMIGAASLMAVGYIYTSGWLIVTIGFVLFWLGLYRSTKAVLVVTTEFVQPRIINLAGYTINLSLIGCYLGLFGGLLGGGLGLILGLINDGRFNSLL